MSTTSPVCNGKERKQYGLRPLGVLQVPLPRLFRVLWSRQRRVLLAVSPTSNQPLLHNHSSGQHEMLLRQITVHKHVPVGQEPRSTVSQVSQAIL